MYYETVDGEWWIFDRESVQVRPLTDLEAAYVIWGEKDTKEQKIQEPSICPSL
jgi:hypothetical protein